MDVVTKKYLHQLLGTDIVDNHLGDYTLSISFNIIIIVDVLNFNFLTPIETPESFNIIMSRFEKNQFYAYVNNYKAQIRIRVFIAHLLFVCFVCLI